MKNIFKIFLYAAAAAVMISCTGKADTTEQSGLEMRSSASFISVGGTDVAYLSVYYDGEEVTGSPDITVYIVQDGETSVYTDTRWSSDVECEVQFYAEWNDMVSPSITVAAVSGMTELPEDPQPDLYKDFFKKTLMVQGTSVGCPYCPYLIVALDEFFTDDKYSEYASHAILASAHSNINVNDPMTNTSSLAIMNSFIGALAYLPALMFDLNPALYMNSNGTASLINKRIETSVNTKASTAISAVVSGTESEGTINVKARVKVADEGSYRIAAWLLEDGIKYFQYNGTGLDIPTTMEHDNAVRAISSRDPVQGTYLGESENSQAGTTADFSHVFNIKDSKIENLGNCHVVIFVTKKSSDGNYYLDNAIDCAINQRVSFQYEE